MLRVPGRVHHKITLRVRSARASLLSVRAALPRLPHVHLVPRQTGKRGLVALFGARVPAFFLVEIVETQIQEIIITISNKGVQHSEICVLYFL